MSNKVRPIVTILVPAYNAEIYLSQCLASIVNQTYPYLQVVVVDDGSEDNTLAIAQQFAKEYSFVEVYHQANSGVATARNKLISLAKGDYILFVDSDDWIESNMIEDMMRLRSRHNVDIVTCNCYMEYKNSTTLCHFVKEDFLLKGRKNILKAILIHKILTGSLCNKILPRRFYEGLSFRSDIWYGEDCLFLWQALLQRAESIYLSSECYYHYRMNESSVSHEKFNFKKMSGHQVWMQICKDTQSLERDLAYLGRITYAIFDMWLLFYAAKDNYLYDENIREYQRNVRENLIGILLINTLGFKKKIFAVLVAFSYSFCRYILK